jgi:hypothetical protein
MHAIVAVVLKRFFILLNNDIDHSYVYERSKKCNKNCQCLGEDTTVFV